MNVDIRSTLGDSVETKTRDSKTLIIQAIRKWGPISRAQLSEILGLSRASISEALQTLFKTDWLEECRVETDTPGKGRPALVLTLTPMRRLALGVAYRDGAWTLGAYDANGDAAKTQSYPVPEADPDRVFRALPAYLDVFVQELSLPVFPFLGIGAPGLVDMVTNQIESAADLGWAHVDILSILKDSLPWPIAVINRHRARGLAECRYGAGRTYDHVVYIGVGSGVAAGIYTDRELFQGSWGGAGELGHLVVDINGPLCACGNRGCLQTQVSESSVLMKTRSLLRDGHPSQLRDLAVHDIALLEIEAVCQAASQGDAVAKCAIEDAADYLGVAMANLVNILNPDCIIIGGHIASAYPPFVERARIQTQGRAMGPLVRRLEVLPANLLENGDALGAAIYAMDTLFHYALSV